jgi:hypothetical protein
MPYRMSGELASKIDCGDHDEKLGRRRLRKALAEHSNLTCTQKCTQISFSGDFANQN